MGRAFLIRNNVQILTAFLALLGAALVASAFVANATSPDDITFPVAELGNCKSERECKAYCGKPDNILPCVTFAERHNLISRPDAAKARKFAQVKRGPGGCDSKDSCETYCNDVTHIDECVAFAEENDLMPREELEEARKVQQALRQGARLPGGCRNKNDCDAYCEDPSHMEECITFAEAAGFIPPDELADARKALAAVKKGAKPPPCRGRLECDRYCNHPDHMEACLTFAEAAGFIPPEELAEAKKALVAVKKGFKPPACRGKAECDAYCGEEDHLEECIAFAEAAGFMSAEEVSMARKTGGKGPGGCKGREECDQFCKNPANEETCFQFGLEHGMIPPEDLQRMEEGKKQMQELLKNVPPEVVTCLKERLGSEYVEGLRQGTARPRDIRSNIETCMAQFGPQQFQGGGEPGRGPEGHGGQEPEGGLPGREPGVGPGGPGPEGAQLPPFEQFPPALTSCIESAIGADTLQGIRSRSVPPPPGLGSVVERCVTEFRAQSFMPPEGQHAPSPEGLNPPAGETTPPTTSQPQPSLNPFSPFFALLIAVLGGF